MTFEGECEECRQLLEAASAAITRQLRAIGRLDLAGLQYEAELIPSLEAVVREAQSSRELAVAAYKEHRKKHADGNARAQAG